MTVNGNKKQVLYKLRTLPDFPAFEAFAGALWRDEAAVMVGAGFSRFCSRERSTPKPPLWDNFKTEIIDALGYEKREAPDTLRLAQEYQALHGESGLTQLINRLVPDERWEPGMLHQKLLELPWRDVLTTNWDTLLERTKLRTPDRVYSCVQTIHDIPHRVQPRIIKLHGSLPSHKPFIFTEEDYRTYPVQFAPFVNLVQQVMLERELCLIGFSGTDPNFLAWSGWVRDTLSIAARRIRLVGVLNLSPVSRALLEERNITPIDLAPLVESYHPDERHQKAYEYFLEALHALKPPSPYEWVIDVEGRARLRGLEKKGRLTRAEIIEVWSETRRAYPGWIICPNPETKRIRWSIPAMQESDEPAEAHLRFSLEKIWRRKTLFIQLDLQDIQEANHYYKKAKKHLTKTEKIDLCTSITAEWRHYREWDKWQHWMDRLGSIDSHEAVLYHAYEMGQRAILDWDDASVLKAAEKIDSQEPIWMMRRAGLLMTLFREREAAKLYKAALLSIRHKLLKDPKSPWLISLEAWAAFFHRVSCGVLESTHYTFSSAESEKTRMRYIAAKADPHDIIFRLERLISEKIEKIREQQNRWQPLFKSGRYAPARHTVRIKDQKCPFYILLELMERTGAPEFVARCNVFSARKAMAYQAISNPDEGDLLTFLASYRGTDKNILEWLMSRMQVASLSSSAVEQLLSVIPNRVEHIVKLHERYSADSYLVFILHLLARVVVRASSLRALDIFRWLIDLLDPSVFQWNSYTACRVVLEGAIEAMGSEERQTAIMLALEMKTPGEAKAQGRKEEWPEVFEAFLDEDVSKFVVNSQSADRIDALIDLAKTNDELDRGRALFRLQKLYRVNKLTKVQSGNLESAIWLHRDSEGWPARTQLYPWVFLELPGNEQAESLFFEKIVNRFADGHVEPELLLNLRYGLEVTEKALPIEKIVACVRTCLAWRPSSAQHFNHLVSHDSSNEIGKLLAGGLLPNLDSDEVPDDIAELFAAPEKLLHISSIAAVAFQIYRLCPNLAPQALSLIRSAIASREPARVYPAYISIRQFIENASTKNDFPNELIELLLHACEQRTQPGLNLTLSLLGLLVKKDLLNSEDLCRLSNAIPHVLEEYHYGQNNLETLAIVELPLVRKQVHRLIMLLVEKHTGLVELKSELEKDPLPEVRLID